MERVRVGDRDALAMLYDRHSQTMFNLARRFLRDPRDAEDLIHDVFLQVWHEARAYDASRGCVRAWLQVRVRSRAIDRVRRIDRARKYVIAAGLLQDSVTQARGDRHSECERSAAVSALGRLSPPLRLVAQLVYVEGWTCREVATAHALPLGTVKSRLAAARSQLRSLCGIEHTE